MVIPQSSDPAARVGSEVGGVLLERLGGPAFLCCHSRRQNRATLKPGDPKPFPKTINHALKSLGSYSVATVPVGVLLLDCVHLWYWCPTVPRRA